MKKVLIVLGLMLISNHVFAGGANVRDVKEAEAVVLSSFTWTAIPAVTSIDDSRIGLIIDMSTNSVNNVYMIFSSSAVPTLSTATYSMVYKESDPAWILPISPAVNLFGIGVGTVSAGTTVYIQQLRGSF